MNWPPLLLRALAVFFSCFLLRNSFEDKVLQISNYIETAVAASSALAASIKALSQISTKELWPHGRVMIKALSQWKQQ